MEEKLEFRVVQCRLGGKITALTEVSDVSAFQFKTEKPRDFKTVFDNLNKRYSVTPETNETVDSLILKENEKERFEKAGFVFVDAKSSAKATSNSPRLQGIGRNKRVFKYKGTLTLIESSWIFIKFAAGTSEEVIQKILSEQGIIRIDKFIPVNNIYRAEVADDVDPLVLCGQLTSLSDVMYTEPNFHFHLEQRYSSSDPNYLEQWYLNNTTIGALSKNRADISAEKAWNSTRGEGVKIAVIDHGFDPNHPEISGNVFSTTKSGSGTFSGIGDFTLASAGPMTIDVHGTACAGAAAAPEGNAKGGAGVAHKSKLILIVLPSIMDFTVAALALMYAAKPSTQIAEADDADGADIISCSLGGNDEALPVSETIIEALDYVVKVGRKGRGTTICWATDNHANPLADDGIVSHPRTVAVSRSWQIDKHHSSAYGPELDLIAPGAEIKVPIPGNAYGLATGTSFATPITAGVGALVLADKYDDTTSFSKTLLKVNSTLTWAEVKDLVRSTAMPIDLEAGGDITWKDVSGSPLQNNEGVFNAISPSDKLTVPAVAGAVAISVNNASAFTEGQAILVGARTTLTSLALPVGAGDTQVLILNNTDHFQVGQKVTLRAYVHC